MNEQQKIEENNAIRNLLSGLKRVEAPGDFDFRVKARIARGRPVERRGSLLPVSVRIAAPMVILLGVGGYLGLDALYAPNNLAVAPVGEIESPASLPAAIQPVIFSTPFPATETLAVQVDKKPADFEIKNAVRPNEKRIVSSAPSGRNPGGGSYVEARRTPRQIFPRGLDPNSKIEVSPKDFDKDASVSARDVLTLMGIEADATFKIGSVKRNSVAERSGLKAGDVVEAVNDQTLTDKTTFGNKFSGKSVRVRRDGKSTQIELKP